MKEVDSRGQSLQRPTGLQRHGPDQESVLEPHQVSNITSSALAQSLRFPFNGFLTVSCCLEAMILLLMDGQKFTSSPTLRPSAHVFHLTSSHRIGTLSSPVITKKGEYNKIRQFERKRPLSYNFYYNVSLQWFYFY